MMGKKLRVRYQAEGSRERELEVSLGKIFGILAILSLSFLYLATSVTSQLWAWMAPLASPRLAADLGSAVKPVAVERVPPLAVAAAEVDDKPAADSQPDADSFGSEPFASAPVTAKLEQPTTTVKVELPTNVISFVDIEGIRLANDPDNLGVHYDILNKESTYVKGYTYGIAKFVGDDGIEAIVASHPGIDVTNPFDKHRFITGLSYGARRFTSKTINFNKPSESGAFTAVWIVVSRAKDVFVKEVPIHE